MVPASTLAHATPLPSSEHIADSSVFRAALRRERLAARMALDEKTHARALGTHRVANSKPCSHRCRRKPWPSARRCARNSTPAGWQRG
jgi:hypothetical protein